MKKKILISIFAALIFTATACGSKDKQQNQENIENNDPTPTKVEEKTIEEQVQNKTEENQDGITFTDIKISEFGATNIVTGKATNNNSEVRNIKLNLKMYNSESEKLLGRVSTILTDLQPSETREFEISIMGDYSTVDQFKVEVENI